MREKTRREKRQANSKKKSLSARSSSSGVTAKERNKAERLEWKRKVNFLWNGMAWRRWPLAHNPQTHQLY